MQVRGFADVGFRVSRLAAKSEDGGRRRQRIEELLVAFRPEFKVVRQHRISLAERLRPPGTLFSAVMGRIGYGERLPRGGEVEVLLESWKRELGAGSESLSGISSS